MIKHSLTLLFSFLLIITIANVSAKQSTATNIAVAEHGFNDSVNQSSTTTVEKTLIRVPRHRRGYVNYVDTDEIWGMAKKVAITVFVLIAVSVLCCIVTTLYICKRCCCGNGNNNRKRNQGFAAVPQPIIIHTNSPNYHPQYQQQQQQAPATQPWALENQPMLPQPSAPPQQMDDFQMELPPPYEKICVKG